MDRGNPFSPSLPPYKPDPTGAVPTDVNEVTWVRLRDQIQWGATAKVEKQGLFVNDVQIIDQQRWRPTTFERISRQKNIYLKYMRIVPMVKFAQRASEPLAVQQVYFEEGSFLNFKINEKTYDGIPIADGLPSSAMFTGTQVDRYAKDFHWMEFPTDAGITIPATGNMTLEFDPPSNLTTGALTGADAFYINTTTLYWLKVDLFGWQVRQA